MIISINELKCIIFASNCINCNVLDRKIGIFKFAFYMEINSNRENMSDG